MAAVKRVWEPMRMQPPSEHNAMARAAAAHMRGVGEHHYRYRMPAMRAERIESWANDLYDGTLIWFEDGTGHFSFKRRDRAAVRDWRHFQAIKNEVAGPDREAVEIYPREDDLVDAANEYHLFILPPGRRLPMGMDGRSLGPPNNTFDRRLQRAGSPRPGGRQRGFEQGLSMGPEYVRIDAIIEQMRELHPELAEKLAEAFNREVGRDA